MATRHPGTRSIVLAATVVAAGITAIAVRSAPGASAKPAAAVPAAAAPASAAAALDAAVSSLRGVGYNLSGTAGSTAKGGNGAMTAKGSVDPSTKSAAIYFTGTEGGDAINVNMIQIDDTFFAKLNVGPAQTRLGVGPNTWMLVNEAKLNSPPNTPFNVSGTTDALDLDGLFTSVANVAYPDPADHTRITGTVDLTAATGVSAPDPNDLSRVTVAAKTTPFTATLDSQGRLTDLKVDADAYQGNLTEEIIFSDFGSPDPVIAPPATNVVLAPQAAYAFFND